MTWSSVPNTEQKGHVANRAIGENSRNERRECRPGYNEFDELETHYRGRERAPTISERAIRHLGK